MLLGHLFKPNKMAVFNTQQHKVTGTSNLLVGGYLTLTIMQEKSHTALFMLSIHSPDNVFMVLVSIFISNYNHICVLCFA